MAGSGNIFLGCISGTSVDGLDVAAITVDSHTIAILHGKTYSLPDELRTALLKLHTPGGDGIDEVGTADLRLGRFIGDTLLRFIDEHGINKSQVKAIGSHGQTIRHRPPHATQSAPFTVQIGDPNQIVETTGISTAADFRRRDMAAGGQGAPLVPPFHQALFASTGESPVVVNIGGISNVSILGGDLRGFDTGPGNALMDAWCSQHLHKAYDEAGTWARSGTCGHDLLRAMENDPFFQTEPPKSTGREYFNLDWLAGFGPMPELRPNDVQATLAELTASSIAHASARWAPNISNLIVCGGGRLNGFLMQRIEHHVSCPVTASEHWNVDGDSLEAAAFAWLAARTFNGLSGNAPLVTGAAGERILGAIYGA